MTQKQAIQLFEERKVRTVWDDEAGKWYVSIVDVIAVLTESKDAAAYWRKLKQRLKAEGNETVTNCHGLKMTAPDGKMRLTDVADVEQLFRLVQSIPSPKAEPFKLWLSSLARERLEEIDDPEQGIDRMLEYYHRKGYSENWINQRLKSIEVRKELTDEWERRGIKKGQEYATLTDIITLVGYDHAPVQAVQGTENRKPARQHDQSGAGAQHACRSDDHRNFERAKTADDRSEPGRGGTGRTYRREYPPRDRSPDRKKNRIAAHGKTGIGRKNSRRDRTPGGGYDRMIRRFAIGLRPQFVTSNSKSQNGISN